MTPKDVSLNEFDSNYLQPLRENSSGRYLSKQIGKKSNIFRDDVDIQKPKDNELLLENKFKDMLNACNSTYLKNRIAKSLSRVKEYRDHTNQKNSFHKTFKYLFFEDKTKLKNTVLNNKYSEMSGINLQDFALSNIVSPDRIQNEVDCRLQSLEKEEVSISRMLDRNKYNSKSRLKSKDYVKAHMPTKDHNNKRNSIHEKDEDLDPLNDYLRGFNIKHHKAFSRFPGIVKERHKIYEETWKTMNQSNCHDRKRTRRDYDNTKSILMTKSSSINKYPHSQEEMANKSGIIHLEELNKLAVNSQKRISKKKLQNELSICIS